MNERFGFIHQRVEIKLLILFVLRHLPGPIDGEALAELVLIDPGVTYFDYKDCLAELVDNAQAEKTAEGYRVTAKGSQNCEVLETSLPYSVRTKALRVMRPVVDEMRRQEMILANHEVREDGVTVYLSMDDGRGSIFDLKILAANERQARIIEANFRRSAEDYYQRFIEALSEERR
ncbi:MAG: DUF4364 family protein [Oscillospiraceae bacterium]|nr:DUF4364 family protein [Oscillospiraceae bacterium]MBR6096794.1 DUF4364 family protein [Oscillospiraceae bacterium]